jgi:hypothetical protein
MSRKTMPQKQIAALLTLACLCLARCVAEVVRIERVVYGGRDLLASFQQEE